MAKVYVSSTIADLKQERRAVMDWLRAVRHQAVDSYLPNSDSVRDSCLDDVGECDLYVLILGHRYGFQPADDNPDGLSITHLEFRRAGQCGIPRIALLRTSIPDVRVSDMENPARAPLVLAFRDEVARDVRPAEFHDEGGLIKGLSTGILGELGSLYGYACRALRLAPRPVFLAGREELLAELDVRLTGDDGGGPRMVALCGLGGAGKTSVAMEYAHRHLGEVGAAWQLAAEDPAAMAAGFGELAAQLGARETHDARDPAATVHAILAAYPDEWLLVFDNAPDQESVHTFLPPVGRGRVLITSQNPNWPPGQVLDVPVLDPEVAADFLVNRTGDPDRQTSVELAGELGGLPLALEQAAAYMQATGRSIAEYRTLFRERRIDLLARGEPGGYDKQVTTTWALAFDQLQQAEPEAIGLLRLLSCYAPEAIPLDLLLRRDHWLGDAFGLEVAPVLMPLLDDSLAVDDAIAALRRYSLIGPLHEGTVSVHRLVQAVTFAQLSAELAVAWRQAAGSLIEAALFGDPNQAATWPISAALLPHAQAALTADSHSMARVAIHLQKIGNYAAARAVQQQILEARERVSGSEHPDTLTARAWLAYLAGRAGDAAAARDQYAALLSVRERVSGPEHPDTLTVRDGLAFWTGRAGDAAAARDQYAALLSVRERVSGPEHPDTLTVRDGLARWTGEAGDAAAARDQYAALLPVPKWVSGPEHPDTLTVRADLARWTGEAGDAAAARDQYAALLPVREQVSGPEHPHTLTVRDGLARWTGRAGDAAAARDQYAALLSVRKWVSGPEHPHTLTVRDGLARWTGEAGDAAAARDQYAALLPVRKWVSGPEHPDTLTVRIGLARWTGEAGDAAAARYQFAALLPVIERVLGPEHPDTLKARNNLAYWTKRADSNAEPGVK